MNKIIKYVAYDRNNQKVSEFAVNEANYSRANKAVVDQKLAMWKRNNRIVLVKQDGKRIWKR